MQLTAAATAWAASASAASFAAFRSALAAARSAFNSSMTSWASSRVGLGTMGACIQPLRLGQMAFNFAVWARLVSVM
jgi:hypothetical protein